MLVFGQIPVPLDVWGDNARHDWPWWKRLAQVDLGEGSQ